MSTSTSTTSSSYPTTVENHLKAYLMTNGAAGHWYDASATGGPAVVPSLLLTTKGRRSGAPLQLPLFYGVAGGEWVVVASNGGAPDHPDWYLNLQSHPDVAVQVGADKFDAVARTVEGAEREALWEVMNQVWPDYDAYQRKTDRPIPVVALRRRASQ